TYEATVKFPKGFSPLLPQKIERKYDFAEFSATYSIKEDTLHGTLHFKTLLHEVPGPDRSKFSTLAKAIEDAERSYIFLKGALRGTGVLGGVLPPAILFGNSPAAIPQLEQALEADPDNGAILLRLSALYCDAGRASDAVALLKKAMEAHPDVPQHLHVALGMPPSPTTLTMLLTPWPKPMPSFRWRSIIPLALFRLFLKRLWTFLQKMQSLPIFRSCFNWLRTGIRLAGSSSASPTLPARRGICNPR